MVTRIFALQNLMVDLVTLCSNGVEVLRRNFGFGGKFF